VIALKYFLHKALLKLVARLEPTVNSTVPSVSAVNAVITSNYFESFYLDEKSIFVISGTPLNIKFPRWMRITHCLDKRSALILVAGERINLPDTLRIDNDTRLYIRFSAAIPNISEDGLSCEILFAESDQSEPENLIAVLPLMGGRQPSGWREAEFDLSYLVGLKGCFQVRCNPGHKGNPTGDWLAISDLCIAREDQLPLVRARSFHELRSRNEIEHFSTVYRHGMYASIQNQRAEIAAGQTRQVRKLVDGNDGAVQLNASPVIDAEPLSGESPYGYASRLLAACIPQTAPNFAERLKLRSDSGAVIKVLSLCSGAARIEAGFASQVGANVEWSLLDINVDLLGLASRQFAPSVKLDLIEANVNDLRYSGEKWDIILCISALHHVVELEKLIKFCHDSLIEGGEFWSIGEYVGRNGNRLWPDAKVEANKLFNLLPDQYRLNRHTNQVDFEIPDNDYSVGCFEGIRSEEIELVLDRWFHPVDVYRRNCFLWRLINLAYSDNYDLQNPEDRQWIVRMVKAEVNHFQLGGRGTELFGVYRPRLLSRNMN
jgi:SAM-dependent methyltransferase